MLVVEGLKGRIINLRVYKVMKKYYLFEKHIIGEYTSKKEAEGDKDNQETWYPENSYELKEENEEDNK